MRSYDSTADIYDSRYADEQEAKYKAALEKVEPYGLVLDVGCGSGLLFKHLSSPTPEIVGADSSRKLLSEVRKKYRAWKNIHLLRADVDNLPLKDDQFDFIFAFTVLQNMPEPIATLKELRRVVKPGANVVVTGLKKVFSPNSFQRMANDSGLCQVSFVDENSLNCYVIVGLKGSK